MGTLFSPKGVCAWGLGRLAGRLRICGSGRFLGSLSDSVSILKTRRRFLACHSGSAHQSSCSAARRRSPCRLPLRRPSP